MDMRALHNGSASDFQSDSGSSILPARSPRLATGVSFHGRERLQDPSGVSGGENSGAEGSHDP